MHNNAAGYNNYKATNTNESNNDYSVLVRN